MLGLAGRMDDPDTWCAIRNVMPKSPLQQVKDSGGREKLISDLAGMVDDLHGEGADQLKTRLSHLSNKKLRLSKWMQ